MGFLQDSFHFILGFLYGIPFISFWDFFMGFLSFHSGISLWDSFHFILGFLYGIPFIPLWDFSKIPFIPLWDFSKIPFISFWDFFMGFPSFLYGISPRFLSFHSGILVIIHIFHWSSSLRSESHSRYSLRSYL